MVATRRQQAKGEEEPAPAEAHAPEAPEGQAPDQQHSNSHPAEPKAVKRGAEGGAPATTEPAAKRRHGASADELGETEEEVAAPGKQAAEAEEPSADEREGAGGPAGGKEEQEEQAAEEQEHEAAQQAAPARHGTEAAAAQPGVLEQGRITFLYRPKVGKEEVASLQDVQRFFILLCPTSKHGAKSRLCVMGKKRLPSVRQHERFFGFVEATAESAQELLEGLGPQQYNTKTRGTRHLAAARAVGQGTYAIVEHKDHSKLLYTLEVPATPGEAQLEFTIGAAGAFVMTVKNVEASGPADPGLDSKAAYPPKKQAEFEGLRWIPVKDTQLLDFPRCEFLLIGAAEEMPEGVGQQTDEGADPGSEDESLLDQLKAEVQADRVGINTTPAATGELA